MTMRGLLDFAFRWSSRCCFQGVGGEQRHAANIIEPSIELKDDKAGGHRFYSLSGCAPCIAPYIALPYILPPFPWSKKANTNPKFGWYTISIYIIYTLNLGLRIAVFDWEREQGRAAIEQGRATREQGGSSEGAEGSRGGAKRRHLSQLAVTCWPRFGETIYIYINHILITYILNLKLSIAVLI